MIKFISENKLISTLIAFLFTSSILWGTWVTNQLFCYKEIIFSHAAVQVAEEKAVSQQVKEVKEDVKEVKDELSKVKKEVGEEGVKLRKDIADNQKELLKLLIDIKRKQ
jgi:3-deoxy-D-manno-octulosonic-acid transferase